MPGLLTPPTGDSSAAAIIPYSPNTDTTPTLYTLHHGFTNPPRISISWSHGNSLRISLFRSPENPNNNNNNDEEVEVGGKVVEFKLTGEDYNNNNGEDAALWCCKIVYESVSSFMRLQNKKAENKEKRSKYFLEYSEEIKSLLGNRKSSTTSLIEDPKTVLQNVEEPSALKAAAWELLHMFYADKQSLPWILEQLVDWFSNYDSLFLGKMPSLHSRLAQFQEDLLNRQIVEDEPAYWQAISSALAVGWLDIVVKLLRLHGSYQPNQTEKRQVEEVARLVSNMPRMRRNLPDGKLGVCYDNKSEFVRAWEEWRIQITNLGCSESWHDCSRHQTKERLESLLQILLGNTITLSSVTNHWVELYIAHFLYIRPFASGSDRMYDLAQECIRLKRTPNHHMLMKLLIGILERNTKVVLAECSRLFGPWVTHATELVTAGSVEAGILIEEKCDNIGGISIGESHRLFYAQVLSSHALTWQIAPIYLKSCMKHGVGLLKFLLYKQPVYHSQVLLKIIKICRMYNLKSVSSNAMKIAGVYHWKHGRKEAGVFWLQQAQDEVRLNQIAQKLNLEQWEGLILLLGSKFGTASSLEFLHKYQDFKKSLQQV